MEAKLFTQICEQLISDMMQWSQSYRVDWQAVFRRWIQSLFTTMKKPCVNRIWSILLFEGYGSLLPLLVSILFSNKPTIMSQSRSINLQSYLENDFLPSVNNINDIIRNFRVIINPSQPSARLFDTAYILNQRSVVLNALKKETEYYDQATKQTISLLNGELNSCTKSLSLIDKFLKDVNQQLDDIRDSSKNDPDVRIQYLRLGQISTLFTAIKPHVEKLQACLNQYSKLIQQRSIAILEIIDTITTVTNSPRCLPELSQIEAVCQNITDAKKNAKFIGQQNDLVLILMASQTCMWNLISVAWEVHEMQLRKIHNEMSWVISKDVMESLKMKADYMSLTYANALKISQTCAKNLLDFLLLMKTDLFNYSQMNQYIVAKEVYQGLKKEWEKKSEEEELSKEFTDLALQTGFMPKM